MPGPPPKNPKTRQRRNKTTTRTTLRDPGKDAPIPSLPRRPDGWHESVEEWWRNVWTSPMASEYMAVHRHGLVLIAELRQAFVNADSIEKQVKIHSEIRLAQRDYGLTPMDLRRLQWETKRVEDKPEKTRPRRSRSKGDPRGVLRIAK